MNYVLSACSYSGKVYALFETANKLKRELSLAISTDGETFQSLGNIRIGTLKKEKIELIDDLNLSVGKEGFFIFGSRLGRKGIRETVMMHSKSGKLWKKAQKIDLETPGKLMPDYKYKESGNKKSHIMFFGRKNISMATSIDMEKWKDDGSIIISSRPGFFDYAPIKLIAIDEREQGMLLIYESVSRENGNIHTKIGAALLDYDNLHQILWRSDVPLYEHECKKEEINEKYCETVGAAPLGEILFLYFHSITSGFVLVKVPCVIHIKTKGRLHYHPILNRHPKNPMITPHDNNDWEKEAVFNPAVVKDDEHVHIIYRAMGKDGISRLGYAKSSDGFHINERLSYPIFEPKEGFGLPKKGEKLPSRRYDPLLYTSGGGWGGSEDPRAVNIDGIIYLTFVAFAGWHSVRMALMTISEEDLRAGNFNWSEPMYISPKGETNKNWVIFPEKINGKFAILHGVSPKIKIDYVENLEDLGNEKIKIKSSVSHGGYGYEDKSRTHYWDNRVRGAGPPPIKTNEGWLLFYHAIDKRDPGKYKLGAMLLDLNDPTKILHRSSKPILCPDMNYENDGKPGVVYASGAVILGDELTVYYGGADKVVCAASIKLEKLLENLKYDQNINLEPLKAIFV